MSAQASQVTPSSAEGALLKKRPLRRVVAFVVVIDARRRHRHRHAVALGHDDVPLVGTCLAAVGGDRGLDAWPNVEVSHQTATPFCGTSAPSASVTSPVSQLTDAPCSIGTPRIMLSVSMYWRTYVSATACAFFETASAPSTWAKRRCSISSWPRFSIFIQASPGS